ncbi:MAG: SDR family oxidoreductase [Chloroflexaceae bacterium]
MTDTTLKGKVVLITGAGSGLGAATAQAFAGAGCRVACLDVNETAVRQTADELAARDVESIALPCDVSNADAVARSVQAVVERFGQLHVVVNNAAIDHTVSIDDMSIEQWDQVIGINLRGPFLVAKAALPVMKQQQSGHIVNVGSTAATRAWANAAAYHAAKWGLIGFSRGLGVECRPFNIRVSLVHPGGMRTHFFDRFVEQGIPMPDEQTLQDPATVAEAILFAVRMPEQSVIQEMLVTPVTETSWP